MTLGETLPAYFYNSLVPHTPNSFWKVRSILLLFSLVFYCSFITRFQADPLVHGVPRRFAFATQVVVQHTTARKQFRTPGALVLRHCYTLQQARRLQVMHAETFRTP